MMPEVSVEINGRKFRMACEDGQKEHLLHLAGRFNAQVEEFKGSFGEIGDNRLTVMAGIAVLDELVEAERRIEELKQQMREMELDSQGIGDQARMLEEKFAKKLAETARKIEAVSTAIDETAQGTSQGAGQGNDTKELF